MFDNPFVAQLNDQAARLQKMMRDNAARAGTTQLGDVASGLIAANAERQRYGGDALKAYSDASALNMQQRDARSSGALQAEASIYEMLNKAAENGDRVAKQTVETTKMLVGDDPEVLGKVLTKMQEIGERDRVNFAEKNPVPYITQAIKETGVTPFSLERMMKEAQIENLQESLDLRQREADIRSRALDLQEQKLASGSRPEQSLKTGALPPGTYLNPQTGMLDMLPATPAVKEAMQNKRVATGRPLSATYLNPLNDAASTVANMDMLLKGFKNPYSGGAVIDRLENFAGKYLPGMSGSALDQTNWWQTYDSITNLERNKLFGSALTETERAAWEKTNVDPSSQPDVIRRNIEKKIEIARGVIDRIAGAAEAGGYNQGQVDYYRGLAGGVVPEGADGEPQQKQAAGGAPEKQRFIFDETTGEFAPKKKDDGGPVNDDLSFIMHELENNAGTINDINNSPVQYGINQAYNKGVQVGSLTEDQAREHYRKEYNLDGFVPASASDAFKLVAQDAIIHHGKDADTKRLIDEANGDPYKLLQLRYEYMLGIPKLQPQIKGLKNRLLKLKKRVRKMESV